MRRPAHLPLRSFVNVSSARDTEEEKAGRETVGDELLGSHPFLLGSFVDVSGIEDTKK